MKFKQEYSIRLKGETYRNLPGPEHSSFPGITFELGIVSPKLEGPEEALEFGKTYIAKNIQYDDIEYTHIDIIPAGER